MIDNLLSGLLCGAVMFIPAALVVLIQSGVLR